MVKHFIIRNELYAKEKLSDNQISEQVCVIVNHVHNKLVTYYESSRESGCLVQGEALFTRVPLQETSRLLFYVNNKHLAIEYAGKWCEDNTTKEHIYNVIGVDDYYSPLD